MNFSGISKYLKNPFFYLSVLLILNCIFISYKGFYENRVVPGEGPGVMLGDKTCINDPAKTLFETNPVKKFENNWFCTSAKPERANNNQVAGEALPLLFGYPAPSFRYGAALATGLITNLFPDIIFTQSYSRPLFANYVLTILIIGLLFYIFKNHNKLILLCFVLILTTDVSYYYNAFIYGTHTIAAIFFSILAISLINNKNSLYLFFFGLSLALSILSSSHLLILNVFIFIFYIYRNLKLTKDSFKSLLIIMLGALIPIIHIILIEKLYLPFHGYKIASFLDQQKSMLHAIDIISSTFAIQQKLILNPYIFNPLFFLPVVFLIAYKIYYWKSLKIHDEIKDSKMLIFFGLISLSIGILTIVALLPKSIPVSRAFTLNSIMIQVGLLSLCLGFIQAVHRKIYLLLIAFIFITSFILRIEYLDKTITPFDITHSKIIDYKNDNAYASNDISKFYNSSHENHIKFIFKIGQLPNNSISIDQFLNNIIVNKEYQGMKYIRFDLLDQMYPYFAARRIFPVYQHNSENVVSADVMLRDYKLFFEILDLDLKGVNFLYKSKPFFRKFSTWDQENNYLASDTKFMNTFLQGENYKNFDMSYIYYVDIDVLKKAKGF